MNSILVESETGAALHRTLPMRRRRFSIAEIRVMRFLQPRCKLSKAVVCDYAQLLTRGESLPPVVVAMIEDAPYLVDGLHRIEAAKKIGRTEIDAECFEGTRDDALRVALAANQKHGLRPTNADKRRAVGLGLATFGQMSDQALAELCGVTDRFVAKLRRAQGANSSPIERIGRDGKPHAVRKSGQATKPTAVAAANAAVVSTEISTEQPRKGSQVNRNPAGMIRSFVFCLAKHNPSAGPEIEKVLSDLLAELRSGQIRPQASL